MIGYIAGAKPGAFVYNAGHSLFIPLTLLIIGFALEEQFLRELGLIWAVYLGTDQLFGFGMKYATEIKDTHFQRL